MNTTKNGNKRRHLEILWFHNLTYGRIRAASVIRLTIRNSYDTYGSQQRIGQSGASSGWLQGMRGTDAGPGGGVGGCGGCSQVPCSTPAGAPTRDNLSTPVTSFLSQVPPPGSIFFNHLRFLRRLDLSHQFAASPNLPAKNGC
jgi:hypothetical protein